MKDTLSVVKLWVRSIREQIFVDNLQNTRMEEVIWVLDRHLSMDLIRWVLTEWNMDITNENCENILLNLLVSDQILHPKLAQQLVSGGLLTRDEIKATCRNWRVILPKLNLLRKRPRPLQLHGFVDIMRKLITNSKLCTHVGKHNSHLRNCSDKLNY